MPQSRPNRHCRLNVGVPSIADIERTSGNGSFVPETDIETEPQLQHLIDVEAPAIAHTRTLSNRTNAIEPGVLFRTGFEVRRSAEIVAGGIDCVATVEAIDDLFGTVPKTLPVHVDHLLVVGLEDNPNLNVEHAVTPNEHPASTPRQHNASQLGAFEADALKASDTTFSVRCFTQRENRYFE